MGLTIDSQFDQLSFGALIRQLEAEGVVRDAQLIADVASDAWCRGRGVVLATTALLPVGAEEVPIKLGLLADFPDSMPEIAVVTNSQWFSQPHVGSDGKLCYRSEDGVLLKREDPLGVIRESLGFAVETLEKGMGSGATVEYLREFVSYWKKATPEVALRSAVTISETPRWIVALADHNKVVALADNEHAFAETRPDRSSGNLSHIRALYLPIDPAAIDDEFHPRELVSHEGLVKYCLPQLARDKKLLKEVERKWKREEHVLLGVRGPEGGRAAVVLRLYNIEGGHPIISSSAQFKVERLSVARFDAEYLMPRGGADLGYTSKKVIVFGCGAVGSQIAMGLARSGVAKLILVDNQRFEVENSYRNALGIVHIGLPKADALKAEIERLVPHVVVESHAISMREYLESNPVAFEECDVVVAATGDHNVERRLNEIVQSVPRALAIVHAWLEPYGLGGHALLSRSSKGLGAHGCLSCLYVSAPGGPIENRAAFAEHGKTYTRDMMGCESSMPFGHLDASRTAELACRVVLQYLRKGHSGGQLLSWKGDPTMFRGAGFVTTTRFDKTEEQLLSDKDSFAHPQCTICSK